jgi:site-specific DNA recombinase
LVANPEYKENTWRLPALELERTILSEIITFLNDEHQWMKAVDLSKITPEVYKRLRRKVTLLENKLHKKETDLVHKTIKQLLKRITVQPGNIDIVFNSDWYSVDGNDLLANKTKTEYELSLPFHTRRRGVESKIVIGGKNKSHQYIDQNLIEAVRRSNEWWQWLTSGAVNSVKAVAERASVDASDVTRYLPLAFLAPDIVEAIVDGNQPIDLNIEHLKKLSPIPANWNKQRKVFGFAV